MDDTNAKAGDGDTVHGHKVGGDMVGGDKITVGDIEGGYNVVGAGAQLTVNIHNELPAEQSKPKLSIEPEMTLISAGPFVMGSEQDKPEEAPQHVIDLPEFHMSVYPITNEAFAQFVWKTGIVVGPALLWSGNSPADDALDHPVAGVTWYEALAYCEWLSELSGRQYTLPSEAQWEKAARGEDGRLYPWGNTWEPNRCNTDFERVTPITAFPAQNKTGCFDMVGNAREWTASLWGSEPRTPAQKYAYPWQDDYRNALGEPATIRRVFRGGRGKEPRDFRCSARGSVLPEKAGPKRNRHGFRVVLLSS